jgi:hypothetical protein
MDEPTQSGLCTPRLADDPAISLDDSAPDRSVTGRPQPTQACMLPLACPTQLNLSRATRKPDAKGHTSLREPLWSAGARRCSPTLPLSLALNENEGIGVRNQDAAWGT